MSCRCFVFAFSLLTLCFVFQSLFDVFSWKSLLNLKQGVNPLKNAKETFISELRDSNSSRISSSCVAMFNIGYGSNEKSESWRIFQNQEIGTLLKAKEDFEQQTEDYLPFTKNLVKLVDTISNGTLKFRYGTRLQIMKGKLPYVPCIIKDYSNEDFHECIKVREERNEPLWIAFFGDSKARNMAFYFLNSTHAFMNWTMDENRTFTEESFFRRAQFYKYGQQMEINSASGERLTLIVTAFGVFSKKNEPKMPTDILLEWVDQSVRKRSPDTLVVEFGSWHFNWINIAEGTMHDGLLQAWKHLRVILSQLANRMAVICHVSTRIRFSGVKHHSELYDNLLDKLRIIQSNSIMNSAVNYIDQVMKHGTRRSSIIFWDTTLPFIMASNFECELLVKHNHSTVAEEGKLRSKHLLPFMCNDPGHKTKATIHDERSFILNLACNRFIFNLMDDYCCTT